MIPNTKCNEPSELDILASHAIPPSTTCYNNLLNPRIAGTVKLASEQGKKSAFGVPNISQTDKKSNSSEKHFRYACRYPICLNKLSESTSFSNDFTWPSRKYHFTLLGGKKAYLVSSRRRNVLNYSFNVISPPLSVHNRCNPPLRLNVTNQLFSRQVWRVQAQPIRYCALSLDISINQLNLDALVDWLTKEILFCSE